MSAAAETGATFDVAVIGLGPVGCLGAILFAEAGLTVVAVEKEPEVYALPRAVNLDGEIIRALQPAGLADAIHRLMQPLRDGGPPRPPRVQLELPDHVAHARPRARRAVVSADHA